MTSRGILGSMFVIPTLDATMLTRRAVRGARPDDPRTTRPVKTHGERADAPGRRVR